MKKLKKTTVLFQKNNGEIPVKRRDKKPVKHGKSPRALRTLALLNNTTLRVKQRTWRVKQTFRRV